jgi:T-complex protein 1 subunit alpha
MNAAKDATELISKMRVLHAASQKKDAKEEHKVFKFSGLDLVEGKVRNNMKAGVLEPSMSKVKSLKFATEAAVTILRIDDRITLLPPQDQ